MHPLRVFIHSFPYLWHTTRHLIWPLKIQFWLQSYSLNKKLCAEHSEWMRREKQGDASLREKCCDLRPTEYPKGKKMEEVPELHEIVKPSGKALGGYVQLYDCTICGQAWMVDWEQEKFGGTNQVKKV